MRRPELVQYSALVFDCDGVILDSNRVKTEAFRDIALPFGEQAAAGLVDFHLANGGVSRYRKIEYFANYIVSEQLDERQQSKLIEKYAGIVFERLLSCRVAPGLAELRQRIPRAVWCVVSGGDQSELRSVFARRGIDRYFDGGIFGSPSSKTDILRQLNDANIIRTPALFLGDSHYDRIAAFEAGLDFCFVRSWSDVPELSKALDSKSDYEIQNIQDGLDSIG